MSVERLVFLDESWLSVAMNLAVLAGLTSVMLVTRLLIPIGYQVIQSRIEEPSQHAGLPAPATA